MAKKKKEEEESNPVSNFFNNSKQMELKEIALAIGVVSGLIIGSKKNYGLVKTGVLSIFLGTIGYGIGDYIHDIRQYELE